MHGEERHLRQNLAELQVDSLRAISLLVGAIGYIWLVLMIWPVTRGNAPLTSWVGALLAAAVCTLAYGLSRQRLGIASAILVAGTLGTVAFAALGLRSLELTYLFALPIIFGSVVLGQRFVFPIAFVACALTAAIGQRFLGLSLFARQIGQSVGVIGLGALGAWLSARNLYRALEWVWAGYEQAHRNEQMARAGQADLRRALKALDEATYRVERSNYMLSIARDRAEEARRLKQQFAQTISHELRTPLNLIVGFTELMAANPEYYGGKLPPAYVRDLSIVHRNALHLRSLVNDVLDLARIEAAQMGLQPEEVEPGALLQDAANTVRGLVESQGLALRVNAQPGLPRIWLDPTRVRQVLINLLSNAARFTERGSITVGVVQQGEELVFSVADTGTGVPAEHLAHIFEEFRQLDGSTRRPHGGAGLGLAISRRFVELHGGRIWAESEVGRGSIFSFALPLQRAQAAHAPGGPPREAGRPLAAPEGDEPVLLAVTRSPAAAGLLARYAHGVRTVVVPDLEQGRQAAGQLLPQTVLVDQAGTPLGADELQRLGADWALPRTPFIACPLPGEESLRQQLAVDAYLIKPISRPDLWDMLRRFGEGVDRVLVIDDDADFAKLLSRMLTGSPLRRYQVVSATTGREGLALVQHRRPDLVFLDLVLPDMDGRQVLEGIRALPEGPEMPVVIVSAQDEMSGARVPRGAMTIARADGLHPVEIVRLVETVVEMPFSSDGAQPGRPGGRAPRPASLETPPPPGKGPGPSA